jgi:Uma2 family endonuclease
MTQRGKARETRAAYRARKPRAPRRKKSTAAVSTSEYPEQGKWTYDDWVRLPDDGTRYEVIDGELYMTPPPSVSHQFTIAHLLVAMSNFVFDHQLGVVFPSPLGVRLPTQSVPLEPDIVYISSAHKSIIGKEYIEGVPDLVVEVLSPGNWMYDRHEKYQLYQTARVPEYWIVDYRAKTVEVFVLEQSEFTLIGKWGVSEAASSRVLNGFQVAVVDIFREV